MAHLEQGTLMRGSWQLLAGLSGFVGVVMGALGAHAVSDSVLQALAERAALYQLLHSLLLLWLAARSGKAARAGKIAIALGLLLFCGSLYGKALFGAPTVLAPAGGILLMIGWLCAAFAMPAPQSGAFKA